jgi:hypothetical protein
VVLHREADILQIGDQLLAVNAMCNDAGGGVWVAVNVLLEEEISLTRADSLSQLPVCQEAGIIGHRKQINALRREATQDLAMSRVVLGDVFHDIGGQDHVERTIIERHPG